jgi:diguanylate cyclase (GGDEF)-like protein/PAS domain S-box-containing protein
MRTTSTPAPMGDGDPQTAETYAELFEDAPCGYLTTTPDGIITKVNSTLERWTGYSREEIVGIPFADLLTSSGRLFYETRYVVVLRLAGEVREVALSMRCADGNELPLLINANVVMGADNQPTGIRMAILDATERQDYERQLLAARREAEASEARVRVLQDASSAFGAATSSHELAEALATSAGDALRAGRAAVLFTEGRDALELVIGDEQLLTLFAAGLQELAEQAMASGDVVTISNLEQAAAVMPGLDDALHRQRVAALSVAPLRDGAFSPAIGVVVCFLGRGRTFDEESRDLQAALARQATQVLHRVRLQQELEHRALHDELTGLANRKLLEERLEGGLSAAARNGRPLSLVFVDLDGFKAINDELGHRVGDEVLAQVAARLRSVARAGDPVARYGGDEFVVVCENADSEAGAIIAERFRQEVRKPLRGISPRYAVAASIGVATWRPVDATRATPDADAILRAADEAMYMSKHSGRDRVTLVTV